MDNKYFSDKHFMEFVFSDCDRPSLAEFLASIDFNGVEKIHFYYCSISLKSENCNVCSTLALLQTLAKNSDMFVSYACYNFEEPHLFEIYCDDFFVARKR